MKATDNGNIKLKRYLRQEAIRGLETVSVLDAYAGRGQVWSKIPHARYFGIEKGRGKAHSLRVVNCDNRLLLGRINLAPYTVIDLDAYGTPYEQLELVLKNPTLQDGTVIIFTFMARLAKYGIARNLLELYGIPAEDGMKMNALFLKNLKLMFFAGLRRLGVKQIHCIRLLTQKIDKYYAYFKVGEDAYIVRAEGQSARI